MKKRRLYARPEDSRLFIHAFLHDTAESMRAAFEEAGATDWDPEIRAYFRPMDVYRVYGPHRRPRKKPKFGEVHFQRGWLDSEILSHEMFHATMSWGRRIGIDFEALGAADEEWTPESSRSELEERLAKVQGELTYQLVVWLEGIEWER